MLELLHGFADDVLAVRAVGRLTAEDYERVLVPAARHIFERHKRVRCYYELGGDFTGMDAGAMWQDLKVGLEHLKGWERVAVVTDLDWLRTAVSVFRFLMPGTARVFATTEVAEAKRWLTEPPPA